MRRVAVIIPLYNRAAYIAQAIRSLLAQSSDCLLSIHVVDDGSTDAGPQIIRAMMQDHPCISMLSTENRGVTRARNTGLAMVSSDAEFVTFLDSDDISPPGRIAADLAVFERHPQTAFTYGLMTLADRLDDDGKPADDVRQVTVRGISLSAGLFRKSLLDVTGAFDEALEQSEDTDYLLRLFEGRHQHRLTDTICVYYRRHAGNMTLDSKRALRFFMLAIKKSLERRKADPAVRIPTDIFDLKALVEARIG